MGFRARKSINLGGGVRLSATKTGLSLSVGARGARHSAHISGRRTASVGIPGSGVGYMVSGAGSGRARRHPAPTAAAAPPKPGVFASAYADDPGFRDVAGLLATDS